MEGGWLISYLALWCLTILLSLVILAHSRLLGLLHHRFGPAAARSLADGPEVGTKLELLAGQRLDGNAWSWVFPSSGEVVLIFISPQCQTCNELLPHVKDFVHAHKKFKVVLVSTIDHLSMNRAYVDYQNLERLNYVIGAKLADDLNIEGTPYALCLSREGVVQGKGLVNNYEHLAGLSQTAFGSEDRADTSRELGIRPTGRFTSSRNPAEAGTPNLRKGGM
jgi:methylamine dehydrogenase accessory protein MauD